MSAGYVRSNLLVLNGGAGEGGGGENARLTGAALGGEAAVALSRRERQGAPAVDGTPTAAGRDALQQARSKGYEGEACGDCGNFTLVRNGTCMKCVTCGATSGCS